MDTKRLFFAISLQAPWPEILPLGRILPEEHRHITLAFLGHTPFEPLQKILKEFPAPDFKVAPSAILDQMLYLPKRHPRVAAAHLDKLPSQFFLFQNKVAEWLKKHGYVIEERPFLPHTTLARAPFMENEWDKFPLPLPCILKDIHLYESLGHLQYRPIWSYPLVSPFQELEHTADIAFLVRGSSINEVFFNAQIALAFKHPPVLAYLEKGFQPTKFEEIVMALNRIITKMDSDTGSPFKAVSYHGQLKETEEKFFQWEMIVDV